MRVVHELDCRARHDPWDVGRQDNGPLRGLTPPVDVECPDSEPVGGAFVAAILGEGNGVALCRRVGAFANKGRPGDSARCRIPLEIEREDGAATIVRRVEGVVDDDRALI